MGKAPFAGGANQIPPHHATAFSRNPDGPRDGYVPTNHVQVVQYQAADYVADDGAEHVPNAKGSEKV